MGQEFKSECVAKDGVIREHSAPLAILLPNTPNSPSSSSFSSSFNASPHWPQSYERTMEVYSRSLSRRSRSFRADSITKELERSLSEQFAVTVDRAGADLRAPLLQGSERLDFVKACEDQDADSKLQTKEFGLCDDGEKEEEEEEDERVHGSSFLQALFNGMNILAGVGILSTPYAVASGGWLGLVFLLLFASLMCYTGLLLRRCLDSHPFISSFPDIGEAAFGKWGRWIISIMLYLELYAVSIEFLILEGDNLAHLFPNASFRVLAPQQVFTVCAALLVLPTVWLRELRLLSFVSAGGVFASLLIVLAVAWVGVADGVGFHHRGAWLHWEGLPVAIGLYSFCYCGHSVFPSIYSSMRDRKQFSLVLIICFVLCTFMYGGIAVMGYMMFGDDLQSQITLNLPREFPASTFAVWIALISPFAKYALTLTPLAEALEELLPHPWMSSRKGIVLGGTMLRTGLVASTVAVALAFPFFGLLMAFIGSFLSVAVSVHIPCICYLRIYKGRLSRVQVSWILLIIGLGSVAGGVGTYYSVREILSERTF